jgi:hypothetical protein
MEIVFVSVSCWSVTSVRSSANADLVPLWAASVTEAQPQPPGIQVVTTDENVFSVPLSNVSLSGVVGVQAGVGVFVDVDVAKASAEAKLASTFTKPRSASVKRAKSEIERPMKSIRE